MKKKKPEWEELEIIVAEIQKQLAPNAEIQHNHSVMGNSGRRRKLDITISHEVGGFPIFIVIDCKHHSKPVKLNYVEAFSGQIDDVNANLGVMVSSSGFNAGAKAVAKQKNIILQTYRKATETDWNELVGERVWSLLTNVEITQIKVFATLEENSAPVETPFNTSICDEKGDILISLEEILWNLWKQMGQPIGDIDCQAIFKESPSFVSVGEGFQQIQNIKFIAKSVAKKYLVNLKMAEGDIIEREENGKPVYRSVASKGFDWAEILKKQPGIEIGHEEYQQFISESIVSAVLSKAKRYIRIVVEDKNK